MVAGGSALRHAEELAAEAADLEALALVKRRQAESYLRGGGAENRLGPVLAALTELEWHVLEDRRWPGSRRANVDFVMVGPGGVVVLDVKDWRELEVRDGTLFRGDAREDDEVAKIRALADTFADHLAPTGLTRAAVGAALVFSRHRVSKRLDDLAILGAREVAGWLARLPRRLSADQVSELLAAVQDVSPPMPPSADREAVAALPVEARPAVGEDVDPPGDSADDLGAALLDQALAAPLEDWMTFLHPEQNRLVQIGWSGPGRIRGPAGTGKSVVALHRAVHLARQHTDPVLFVSFVKTLPQVFEGLAQRLAPEVAQRIEFTGVHAFARSILAQAGEPPSVSRPGADAAFRRAWRSCPEAALLLDIDPRESYWREEVDHVVRPRRLPGLDAYLALSRVGRVTPLRASARAVVWALTLAYEEELRAEDLTDFTGLLLSATDVVGRTPEAFRYSAVVVDEVQDLNLAGMRLLATVAEHAPGSLLLVGDGRQSVYPGGFSLAEADLSVAGRAAVLTTNYRNTRQVLEHAHAVLDGDVFEDLGELAGGEEVDVVREGPDPIVTRARSRRDLEAGLASILERSHAHRGRPWGDFAVLTETRADTHRVVRLLRAQKVPCQLLDSYRGTATNKVKVGTVKRAKGLEFPYVFLPYLSEQPPAQEPGEPAESHRERVDRWRHERYVGMTRARDGLWLGYLETGAGDVSSPAAARRPARPPRG
ncbi:3'-5' exonuclease [Nocardioides sp. GY 10127]|uniref:3'-5' exonuclease n=1 Tax=Nocardioides sp. GY 10127 TaxID=2569762 RepID=UPI0010A791C8|nr:3'-5' exonuclease [Nocardioides sp. GY 10127]TIC84427.1 NERD nuclease [Nocardioides sp. GY 10127]